VNLNAPPLRRRDDDSARETRILRDRHAALSRAVDRQSSTSGQAFASARMALSIYDGGNMPTSAGHFFLGHPVTFTANECEACSDGGTVDTNTSVPVLVLGTTAPSVGDILTAYAVGGRWVAERGGGMMSKCGCAWFCNAAGTNHDVPGDLPAYLDVTVSIYGTFRLPKAKCNQRGDNMSSETSCGYFLRTTVNFPGSGQCPAVNNVPVCFSVGIEPTSGQNYFSMAWGTDSATVNGNDPSQTNCELCPGCFVTNPVYGISCPGTISPPNCGCSPEADDTTLSLSFGCGSRPLNITKNLQVCPYGEYSLPIAPGTNPTCFSCECSTVIDGVTQLDGCQGFPRWAYVMFGGACTMDGGPQTPVFVTVTITEPDPYPDTGLCDCCLVPCNPVPLPTRDLQLAYTNVINGSGTTALAYNGTGWQSGCTNGLTYELSCNGGNIELRAIYYTTAECPNGTRQYCSNQRQSPQGLTLSQSTYSPLSLTFECQSDGCPALTDIGYTQFVVTDPNPVDPSKGLMCQTFGTGTCGVTGYPLTISVYTSEGGTLLTSGMVTAGQSISLSWQGFPAAYFYTVSANGGVCFSATTNLQCSGTTQIANLGFCVCFGGESPPDTLDATVTYTVQGGAPVTGAFTFSPLGTQPGYYSGGFGVLAFGLSISTCTLWVCGNSASQGGIPFGIPIQCDPLNIVWSLNQPGGSNQLHCVNNVTFSEIMLAVTA
jgi:hypothetical protein